MSARSVNGAAGVVVTVRDRIYSVMALTVSGGRVAEIDIVADPERLERLDLASADRVRAATGAATAYT